jgi:hypothetical protein
VLVESAGYAKEYHEHTPDKMSLRVGSLKKVFFFFPEKFFPPSTFFFLYQARNA